MGQTITRRVALAALGTLAAGSVVGLGYLLRSISYSPGVRLANGPGGGGMMGVGPADMSLYMDMFSRHTEINRTVEESPGGVRTTTESKLIGPRRATAAEILSRPVDR